MEGWHTGNLVHLEVQPDSHLTRCITATFGINLREVRGRRVLQALSCELARCYSLLSPRAVLPCHRG